MKKIQNQKWVLLISSLSLAAFSSLHAKADYPACPQNQTAEELEKWRQGAMSKLGFSSQSSSSSYGMGGGYYGGSYYGNETIQSVTTSIESCFPTKIPACLQHVHDYAEQQWTAYLPPATETAEETQRRVLPKEFWDQSSVSNGKPERFVLFQQTPGSHSYKDIEQIAREKGWPMVRYKSRMSGGFDDTTSLLMIRVPGNKLTPPVNYDQYVNIPIPAEPNDRSGPLDQVKAIPEKKLPSPDEYRNPNTNYSLGSTVTVVTVEKKDGNKPGKVYFTFYRRYGEQYFRRDSNPSVRSACYSCHPNGVRAISPYGYHVRDSEHARGLTKPEHEWLATQEMNNSMNQNNGFEMVDWGKVRDPSGKLRPLLNPAGMGPVVGPIHPLNKKVTTGPDGHPQTVYPSRTKEFIVGEDGNHGCARSGGYLSATNVIRLPDINGRGGPGRANVFTLTDNPPINWQKVRDQMSCASCHNNRIRGSLNMNTSFNEIAFKILVDQSMPAGAHVDPSAGNGHVHDDLNPNERIALVNCLRQEFDIERTKMPEWLAQVSCSGDSNSNVTSAINGVFPQTVVGTPAPVPPEGVTTRSTPVPQQSSTSTPETQPSSAGRAN